jgi:hypothetical protein
MLALLMQTGICDQFHKKISGLDELDRQSIMLDALRKLGGSFDSVTYFGDGTWDREASAGLGWEFVAVGNELGGIEHYAPFFYC